MDELLKKLTAVKDEILATTAANKAAVGADMDKVNAHLARLDEIYEKDIKGYVDEVRKRNVQIGIDKKEAAKFDYGMALRGILNNDWSEAGFEKECFDAARAKSSNTGEGASGAYLIATEISKELIDLAAADIVMMQMGVSVYSGLAGELPIPKITGRPSLYWVGEEQEPTESTTTFGEIVLRPKTAAAFAKISRKLIKQSRGVADKIVREQLQKAFALGLESAFLNGLGNEKQPSGIFRMSGMTADPTALSAGARFTHTSAAKMVAAIDQANMLKSTGKYSYLMHPNTKWGLKMEKIAQFSGDTGGNFVVNPMISDKALEDMIGYSIKTTTLVPMSNSNTRAPVIFGDFSQYAVGLWGGMELKASEEAGNASGSAYTQRQVWLIGFQDVDTNIKDATGLVKTTNDVMADLTAF